jgi:hypothetical protein
MSALANPRALARACAAAGMPVARRLHLAGWALALGAALQPLGAGPSWACSPASDVNGLARIGLARPWRPVEAALTAAQGRIGAREPGNPTPGGAQEEPGVSASAGGLKPQQQLPAARFTAEEISAVVGTRGAGANPGAGPITGVAGQQQQPGALHAPEQAAMEQGVIETALIKATGSEHAVIECTELGLRLGVQPSARADLARLYRYRLTAAWPATDSGSGPVWVGLRLTGAFRSCGGVWLDQALAQQRPNSDPAGHRILPDGNPGAGSPSLVGADLQFELPGFLEPGQHYHLEVWSLRDSGLPELIAQQPLRIVDAWIWELQPAQAVKSAEAEAQGPETPLMPVERNPGPAAKQFALGHSVWHTGPAADGSAAAGPLPERLEAVSGDAGAQPALTPSQSAAGVASGPRWQAAESQRPSPGAPSAGPGAQGQFAVRLRLAGLVPGAEFRARLHLVPRAWPSTSDKLRQGWQPDFVSVRSPGGVEGSHSQWLISTTGLDAQELQGELPIAANPTGHAWLELCTHPPLAQVPSRIIVWLVPR